MKKEWMLRLGALAAVLALEGILFAVFSRSSGEETWLRFAEMAAGVVMGMLGAHAALSLRLRGKNTDAAREMKLRMEDERGTLIASKVNGIVATAALVGLAVLVMTAAAMENRAFMVLGMFLILGCWAAKIAARRYYEKKY